MAEILTAVRPLAAKFYQLTKKPLGVTGEVAEQLVAGLLGLTLMSARTTLWTGLFVIAPLATSALSWAGTWLKAP